MTRLFLNYRLMVDIIFLILLFFAIAIGYFLGFSSIVIKVSSFFISLFISFFLVKPTTNLLVKYDIFYSKLNEFISKKIDSSSKFITSLSQIVNLFSINDSLCDVNSKLTYCILCSIVFIILSILGSILIFILKKITKNLRKKSKIFRFFDKIFGVALTFAIFIFILILIDVIFSRFFSSTHFYLYKLNDSYTMKIVRILKDNFKIF